MAPGKKVQNNLSVIVNKNYPDTYQDDRLTGPVRKDVDQSRALILKMSYQL